MGIDNFKGFEQVKKEIKAEKEAPMMALAQELPLIKSAVLEAFIDTDTGKVNRGEGYSSAVDINDVWEANKDVSYDAASVSKGLSGLLERLAAKGITRSTNELVKKLDNLNNAKKELEAFRSTPSQGEPQYSERRDALKENVSTLAKEAQEMLPSWELLITGAA